MILHRLRVDGFGTLQGEWTFDPLRVNLVVGENERGKTTLAAAITAALYGLEGDKRQYIRSTTPLEHYKPWSGRTYALELEFEHGGKRYLVNRNFTTNKTSVLEDGRDATEDFRHGSGEYMVGEELLGLNADQFARTALWLQPGPSRLGGEHVQPDKSLSAILERMASSVTGDASSVNALQVLDEALKNYRGMQQSGNVVGEIKKLGVALGANQSDLTAAEQDRAALAESLARLAELEERERALTVSLTTARRAGARGRIAELQALLERDTADRAQRADWQAEVATLAAARAFPKDAADRLRHAQAERAAAQRTLDTLAVDREREVTAPRKELETTLATNAPYGWAQTGHIEELHTLEKDLERVRAQTQAMQDKRDALEKELTARGVSFERVIELTKRFGGLTGDDRTLLTQYPAQTQAIVVESENAQRAVAGGQALIDEVTRVRGRMRVFGLIAAAFGLLAGAGSVWLAVGGWVIGSFAGLGLTLLALAAAALFLLRSAAYKNAERAEALKQMLDAQRRMGDLRTRRREREEMLLQLAERLEFSDVTALLREHGEFLRLTTESQRMGWIEEDRVRAERAESETLEHVTLWAKRAGLEDGTPAPDVLAKLRIGIGAVLGAQGRVREVEQTQRRLDTQEEEARRRVKGASEEMADVARKLGVTGADTDLVAAVEARAADHARLTSLEGELLPRLEERLVAPPTRAAHEAEIVRLTADLAEAAAKAGTGAAPEAAPPAPAIDAAAVERELERVRRERLELVQSVGGRDRNASERIAQRLSERVGLTTALARATRFKEAVELARERFQAVARETHARWSESLSVRVDELLTRFGLGHQSFQISDGLELSLTMGGERLGKGRLDQALSAGARDQLRLALRIAICEYLARGGDRLPLLFDDPLATSDEDRTVRLLRTLSEAVRAGHQVLVLTCHRAKLEAARAADPAWFADTMAITELGLSETRRAS